MNLSRALYALPLAVSLAACASSTPPADPAPASAPAPAAVEEAATEAGHHAADTVAAEAAAAANLPPPRKDDAKRKSKNGRLEADFGGAKVIVQYGRPEVRGRTIFGDLVAYGKLWRTGADEATTFTVDKAVTIEGKPLAAGTYALFTIPGEKSWTIVFNSLAAQWGSYGYKEAQDVLRVDVTPQAGEMTEAMTFSAEGDALVLSWDKTKVPVRIAVGG